MAGQHVVIIQGRHGEDMTKIISLNDSSLFLWNKFSNSALVKIKESGSKAEVI